VIRLSVLLVLLAAGPVRAQELLNDGFDQDRLIAVYSEALSFIAPRTLDPVPVPRLTLWGLRGLTELDPGLRIVASDTRLQLFSQTQMVLDVAMPDDAAPDASGPDASVPNASVPNAWAKVAAALTVASLPVSAPVRQAGIQVVIQGFFDQMFSQLDPYSRYLSPVEAIEDRARRAGRAELGLTLGQHGPLIEVQSVLRDSPAATAGLRFGDVVVAINGQRTRDQDLATIAASLFGPEGSVATLSWRGRDGRLRDARMLRIMVPPETVFPQRLAGQHWAGVLVLRVTSFSNSTAEHLALLVQEALAAPRSLDGIILDLRANRGGLLRQAVTAADIFLPAGVVATTIGRDPDGRTIWRSTEGELAENVPLIILVDGRTASAAEILAAALADRGRAVVVGSATVGKGMVQTIDPLPDGGELFVTWSQTLTPLGWPIQGLGVLPQVCTSLGQDALNRQLLSLSTGIQPMTETIRRSRTARNPVPASEVQDIRASCPASEGRPADLEAARQLIINPAAYAAALLSPMRDP
jgi:carboxyl-terminal processing protease